MVAVWNKYLTNGFKKVAKPATESDLSSVLLRDSCYGYFLITLIYHYTG